MIFQQIRVPSTVSDDEQDREIEGTDENESRSHEEGEGEDDGEVIGGVEQPLRLLQAHGITMIPVDNDTTIVENAMESGQTVVLTGRLKNLQKMLYYFEKIVPTALFQRLVNWL